MQNYVLTYGAYEDTLTVGIFSTRALAERRILDDLFSGLKIEAPNITEWEVDAEQAGGRGPDGGQWTSRLLPGAPV